MKYEVYLNAGVEWWTEVEAENQEEAENNAQEICLKKLGDLRDYNFELSVTPASQDKE